MNRVCLADGRRPGPGRAGALSMIDDELKCIIGLNQNENKLRIAFTVSKVFTPSFVCIRFLTLRTLFNRLPHSYSLLFKTFA